MATFMGDLLRLLAHTGFQTAGGIGTQLVSSYLKPGMEVREAAGKNLLDVIRTQTGPEAEAAAESLEQDYRVKWPRTPVVNPLAPQAGTRYTGPEGSRLTALAGVPQSKLEELATAGYKPETALVRGKATLEEQAAAEATATGVSPLEILARLRRADQPRGEFATLANMALEHPDPTIRAAAKAKMEQPSEMMDFRKEVETRQAADAKERRNDAMERHQDRLDDLQYRTRLYAREVDRRGDEEEQNSLRKALTAHEKYVALWKERPPPEDAILEAGRAYKAAREVHIKRFPISTEELPPVPREDVGKTWGGLGTEYQRPVAPSKKVPGATTGVPTPTTLTFPRRVKAGGQEIIVNSQEEYDELKRKYTK